MKRAASIRIGNQTAFSAPTIALPFEYAVSSGFDAFEWFPDKKDSGAGWQASDLSKGERVRIRDTALEHGIRLSVHAPWQANPLMPKARSFLFSALDLADDVGASLLNIHLYTEAGITAYVEAILPLLERLAEVGVDLSIENTPLTGPSDFNELFIELHRRGLIDGIRVGMCLDLGHANLCEMTRNDYLRFMDELDLQVQIIHAHVHENYGDEDSHLPLFAGPAGIDDTGVKGFVARMLDRHFSGSFILEQWPDPPRLLNQARDRLLFLIGNAPEPEVSGAEPDREREKQSSAFLPSIDGDDFAAEIARADRQFHSWRKKLGWVHDLVDRQASRLSMDQLVYLAIYLRFMGTGEIPFGEDGGHYRPSHHARMARDIQERLTAMATPENVLIIRKIYPWLPSYDSAFTRAEPLTRIRDIAHRNDIPQELKREIKTTLQNKLHRCAGPEDLATSEKLLARVTDPSAHYSPAFVDEFKRFHAELKEFFNARSLQEQLEGILQRQDAAQNELIRKFLETRGETHTLEGQAVVLEALTCLRSGFLRKLEDKDGAEAQELQMADIKLEDYCFVLLSRLVNEFEPLQGNIPWGLALQSVKLVVENLRLSGFDEAECRAIESALKTRSVYLDVQDREQLIELKAILERAGRLAEVYCNKILTLFPERSKRLGRLLGVAEHAVQVFAEADIRSHPVFQLSRLIAILLKRIRILASLPPWDLIVAGDATGRLVERSCLEDASDSGNGSVIALLDKVEGDEEIPPEVAAIVVVQPTPHLSHLAVRARQAGIVFVVCEDSARIAQLRKVLGEQLNLRAVSGDVAFDVSSSLRKDEMEGKARATGRRSIHLPAVELSPKQSLLALNEITPRTGGEKAYGAKLLGELSAQPQAGFMTPAGLVVPFGVMEEALQTASELGEDYRNLMKGLDDLTPDDLVERLRDLQGILVRLPVPEKIVAEVAESFSRDDRLMVRSSSNSEDLEGLAGAGLYESVGNVEPQQVAGAVRKVWSSLWTRRAAMARKHLGIPHENAHMAVLIQQMLVPRDLSFIMHTVNPVGGNPEEAYVELAVGLGETLAAGKTAGEPYRLVCGKKSGAVEVLAFANFSRALWPGPAGDLLSEPVDYSAVRFTADKKYRKKLGSRLGAIARFVEKAFGQPQDVEGLVSGDIIYLVQSRPQQGGV